MRIEELHRQAESQRLEFKESFGRDTVKTVAAFCNATGGIILIGVDKKGNIKGVDVTEEIMQDWVNVLKQATQPQIFPEISPVVIDGKTVVSINGFTRSGLDVTVQDTAQDTAQDVFAGSYTNGLGKLGDMLGDKLGDNQKLILDT